MKQFVAAVVGKSGSGTSALAARIASILNLPFASFGAYVRAEAARRGLAGTRHELQDLGAELLGDTEAFCRAVIAQSLWRPGQSLIVDGLRHEEVLVTLRRLLSPAEVTEIYLRADEKLREARLRERGEVHLQGLLSIDSHPVEKQLLTTLPDLAKLTVDAHLPEEEQVDQLVEFLMEHGEIPPFHAWITRERLVRIPLGVRRMLDLKVGDRVEFGVIEGVFVGAKTLDEDRMRAVFGRFRQQLMGIDPSRWIEHIRDRTDTSLLTNESSD